MRNEEYSQQRMDARAILSQVSIPRYQNYEERQFEDSHLTKFLHQQLLLTKFFMTNLALTSILLSILKAFSIFTDNRRSAILILQSTISLLLVLLIINKHLKYSQLKLKQLIKKKQDNSYLNCIKNIWFQLILLIIHPNILTDDVIIHAIEPIHGQTIPLELNSILEIIMLARIYLLYDAIVSSSIYCSTRASRMCRIYSTKDEGAFGPKSFFNAYPLHSLAVLYVSLVIIFSRMLSLAEQYNPNFTSFQDFVWCTIITMGTIGYGDYYPGTYLGRIIAFFSALSGIIWASLLILTLSQYLTMSSKQSKSHVTLARLQLRSLLEKYAQQTMAQTSNLNESGGIQGLKKKSQRVKLTMRRLKNKVDSDNLNQQISNLFQSLYGNLADIYLQQQTYASALSILHKQQSNNIQQMNFTFAGQIQNIIKDK